MWLEKKINKTCGRKKKQVGEKIIKIWQKKKNKIAGYKIS